MSQTTRPIALDLGTINEVQQVVVRALRDRVCEWEQASLDAAAQGDYRSAQQYREWSFSAELCASAASTACTAVFMDAFGSLPVVTDTRMVRLPDLGRSPEDRRLDDLTIEVASSQPDPF